MTVGQERKGRNSFAPPTPLFSPAALMAHAWPAGEGKEGPRWRNCQIPEHRSERDQQTDRETFMKDEDPESQTEARMDPDRTAGQRQEQAEQEERRRGGGRKNGDARGCQMGREEGSGVRHREGEGSRRDRDREAEGHS